MTTHPYNRHVQCLASNKIITTHPPKKTTLSHTQLLCLVTHGLNPVDVPLFIAGVEAIKMSNGQFPNFVPLFVRPEINDLFGYPKKAPPPGPVPNMGNDVVLEVPAPPQTAPTMGSKEVSVVVESEPLHHSAIPFGTKSCPLLAKTPVWAIAQCLERMTSVRKEYRLYPCTLEELGEATNDVFLIEGVLNLKNPPPEVNEWNKHIPCGPEMNYWKGSDLVAKEQKIVTVVLFILSVGYFSLPFSW